MSPVEEATEPGAQSPGWLDHALDVVDRASERVSFAMFRFGIYVTMPALVVLVTLDVLLRYAFNAPLEWARDTNGLLLIISLFCALPHAWDRAYHIRMEVFYDRFTTRRRRWVDVLSAWSGVVFFGFMAVQAALFVPFMIQTGETGEDLDFVLWPFMGIVSFCAFVMMLRVFSNPAGEERRVRYHLRHGGEAPGHGAPAGSGQAADDRTGSADAASDAARDAGSDAGSGEAR